MSKKSNKSSSYSQAGVSLDAAQEVVEKYRGEVESTKVPGVIGGLGGFGGLFALDDAAPDIDDPVLVSGTDGVGTKLKLAFDLDRHDTIGIDLVAMCVNDIVTVGAKPLFFLDYLATGNLVPDQAAAIVAGIAAGCRASECALIGGETAEMPGFYRPKEYDVAGFAVGVVDRKKILDRNNVHAGDILIGVASSGFHSNGYSLVRKIVADVGLNLKEVMWGMEKSLGELLLEPTYIYTKLALELVKKGCVRSMAHITGGGFYENLPRCLPEGLGAVIDPETWQVPPVIQYLCEAGEVPLGERYHVFNMGIGLVLCVGADEEEEVLKTVKEHGFVGATIGTVEGATVRLKGVDDSC